MQATCRFICPIWPAGLTSCSDSATQVIFQRAIADWIKGMNSTFEHYSRSTPFTFTEILYIRRRLKASFCIETGLSDFQVTLFGVSRFSLGTNSPK